MQLAQLVPTCAASTWLTILLLTHRTLLLGGDFFLGGVVAATLAKLVLRLRELGSLQAPALHRTAADCMLVGSYSLHM